MKSLTSIAFLFRCPLFLFLLFRTSIATQLNIPSLSPIGPTIYLQDDLRLESLSVSDEFETFFYDQTLDHFNYRPESYETFKQRYVINSKYWGGANSSAPIFVYLGAEAPIDGDLSIIGFLPNNAPHFNALMVYIEHRYYGKSIPFGSREEALKNASTIGYFNSAQAIADYAAIILHVKKTLHAKHSPVIVLGGSYGGMLASWFRLKYPHVCLGALASSAPILYFDDITPQDAYFDVASKDYLEVSESCYNTIKKSWDLIDEVASQSSDGLSILSNKFRTCKPLNNSSELKDYLDLLYSGAAQYNAPPKYPVQLICGAIDGSKNGDDDLLGKIFDGLVAYKGNLSCYINPPTNASETSVGFRWQRCSEMVMPIGRGNETMFPPSPFDLESYINDCKSSYGVSPRPNWVTTYYGGHRTKLILKRFGSNIIFSNGLKDPYSAAGVLENISENIVALKTTNGSHCLDILHTKDTDPDWLIKQRNTEIKIIEGWISEYYADLNANSYQKN